MILAIIVGALVMLIGMILGFGFAMAIATTARERDE